MLYPKHDKYKAINIIFLTLMLLTATITGSAKSEILMSSAGHINPAVETVLFSLGNDDIWAWEESGEGKYIYFTLSDEKNEELGKITTEHLGQPMRIEIKDTFILIPEITDILNQGKGFVLNIGEGRRLEMLRLLGKDKKKSTKTNISINTELENKL